MYSYFSNRHALLKFRTSCLRACSLVIYPEVKWSESRSVVSTLCDPMDYPVHGVLQARTLEWGAFPFSRGSSQPRNRTWVLPHCGRFLYRLSHKESPRILEWVAHPFSSGSSQPRNWTRVSCIAGGFFTNWAIREALVIYTICLLIKWGTDPVSIVPAWFYMTPVMTVDCTSLLS